MPPPPPAIRVPARIHLAGNPSDGYGGAVLSTVVPDLAAAVRAHRSARVSVSGPERTWASVADLADDAVRHGHDGGDRLVTAALAALHRLLPASVGRLPVSLEWDTTIPRSVGLGGSSAIVLATMRATLAAWGVEVPPHELAEAALVAETEDLGIAAGLADRVAQVSSRTVLTDCRGEVPDVAVVTPAAPVDVLLAWNEEAAAPSGRYHGSLRGLLAGGGPDAIRVRAGMAELAELAVAGAEALATGDRVAFAGCLDASLDARCRLGPVPPEALAPVAELHAAGASVNFAGSGGAVVIHPASAKPPAGWTSMVVTVA